MKKLVLIATLLAASVSHADCFRFINGKGPDRIGNYAFAAQATDVCVNSVHQFGGKSYISVRFSDSQGDLAAVSAQPASDSELILTSGNINGANVNVAGVCVDMKMEVDEHLGLVTGVLAIQAGRDFPQQYLIMETK